MAELFRFAESTRSNDEVRFVCYSERGLIAYLMFRYLYKARNLKNFLKNIQLIDNEKNPFKGNLKNSTLKGIRVFSECDLGDFGCPDSIIAFEFKNKENDEFKNKENDENKNKYLFFIEAKINESVARSNKGNNYGSTINGQLELKWRLFYSYHELEQKEKIEENDEIRAKYLKDRKHRTLKIKCNGVKMLFEDYFAKVPSKNIFFIALTNEKNIKKNSTPFKNEQELIIFDKFFNNNFGWIDIKKFFKNSLMSKGLLQYKKRFDREW